MIKRDECSNCEKLQHQIELLTERFNKLEESLDYNDETNICWEVRSLKVKIEALQSVLKSCLL